MQQITEVQPTDFVRTRSSDTATKDFQTVVYRTRKPKEKPQDSHEKTPNKSHNLRKQVPDVFNLNKAKHEIVKFGLSGLNSTEKTAANIQLAVKLGAKPPRNRYKNYKKLLEERAQEKLKRKSEINLNQMGKNNLRRPGPAKKNMNMKKRSSQGLLEKYGKVKTSDTAVNKPQGRKSRQ